MTHPSTYTVDPAYRRRRTHTYRSRLKPKTDPHRQVDPEGMRPPINSERTLQRMEASVGVSVVAIQPSRSYGGAVLLEGTDVEVTTLPEPTYDRRTLELATPEVVEKVIPIRHSPTRQYPVNPWTPLQQYIVGIDEDRPSDNAAKLAVHLAQQAIWRSTKTEIDFDDEDGSLLFDLRLPNGLLLMAELYSDGTLYVGVHDDRGEGESKLVEWLENPAQSKIIELFSEE